MAFDDDRVTFGFNRADAEALAKSIGGADAEFREGRPRSNGLAGRVFVTPSGGIPARSGALLGSATCTRYTVSGGTRASTSDTVTVYNDFTSAIGGSVDIVAIRVDGIWLAIAEDCP